MGKKNPMDDKYVHEMDWGKGEALFANYNNYRKYQFNLIRQFIGKNILEVGSGDKGFTRQIVAEKPNLDRLVSIEPSPTLFQAYKDNIRFPPTVSFQCVDLFDIHAQSFGSFDTIIFIHVLEHIENDKQALDHAYNLLQADGTVLIEVPALQCLYSHHDESLGHYRRYDKEILRLIVDPEKYAIEKIWYQDPIGVIGSLYFFKIRRFCLKSDQGLELVKNEGKLYDKFIIPIEETIEKFVTFPFGLSLTAILKKI